VTNAGTSFSEEGPNEEAPPPDGSGAAAERACICDD
jgi:hypothetical protein